MTSCSELSLQNRKIGREEKVVAAVEVAEVAAAVVDVAEVVGKMA